MISKKRKELYKQLRKLGWSTYSTDTFNKDTDNKYFFVCLNKIYNLRRHRDIDHSDSYLYDSNEVTIRVYWPRHRFNKNLIMFAGREYSTVVDNNFNKFDFNKITVNEFINSTSFTYSGTKHIALSHEELKLIYAIYDEMIKEVIEYENTSL